MFGINDDELETLGQLTDSDLNLLPHIVPLSDGDRKTSLLTVWERTLFRWLRIQ